MSIGKFLRPLWIFVLGMLFLAFSTLFYPAIMTQATQTQAEIGDTVASHYWGLSWGLASPRLIIFLTGLLMITFSALWWWVKRKWGQQ
jgi:hypothetical protein